MLKQKTSGSLGGMAFCVGQEETAPRAGLKSVQACQRRLGRIEEP
jgi:hypothetical protein